MEAELRYVAFPQAVTHLIANVRARRGQALHRLLLLVLVALYSHINSRRLPARIQEHFRDVAQPNAAVSELALQDRTDLVLQGLGYAVTMMIGCTSLRHDFGCGKTFQDNKKRFPLRELFHKIHERI